MQTRWVVPWIVAGAVTLAPTVASAHGRSDGRDRPVIRLDPLAARELRAPHETTEAPVGGISTPIVVEVARGPLMVMGAPQTVTLTRVRHSDRFRATVSNVRVVDARGTNAGWQLRASVDGVRGRLGVGVTRVVAMAASTRGLSARARLDTRPGQQVRLAEARRGTGAGSFAVTLELDAVVPRARADQVTATVAFDVR